MNTKLVSSFAAVSRTRLVTIYASERVLEAAKLLSSTQIGLLVVCEPSGEMVGIVTKTDIVQQMGHCEGRVCQLGVADIMVRDVVFCSESDLLPDVLARMTKLGLVHIPVIDGDLKPLGIVNARDAFRELLAEEQYEETLLRDYVMGVGYR